LIPHLLKDSSQASVAIETEQDTAIIHGANKCEALMENSLASRG